ncbi:hypothetical protein [Streptomyces sp. NPDC046805]|uniref:hypothetical protein n=1 Tax=Streptomyces sp. NPDC046805 TaxID=3155134 RepID=UPI0033E10E0D
MPCTENATELGHPPNSRRQPPVDDVIALVQPFVDYFALDRELSREYASTIVRGRHDSAIFQNLGLTLIGEIQQVLSRAWGTTRSMRAGQPDRSTSPTSASS